MRHVITTAPSPAMRLVKGILAKSESAFKTDAGQWCGRVEGRADPPPAPAPRGIMTRFQVDEAEVQGRPVFTVAPRQARRPVQILYVHGGGFVSPLSSFHWTVIRTLIEYTGAAVTIPIYPLAPVHNYRAAYPLLDDVYCRLLHDHPDGPVCFCGDSAGGGLALAHAMRCRDSGLRLPDCLVLLSPWVDLTMSNPEAALLEAEDVMLGISSLMQAGAWWAGGDDPRSPLVSPIFGDLSGLPPVYVFQGTADVLAPDARRLHDAVAQAGGTIELYEYTGAFHVFVGAPFTPEAKDAFSRVAAVLDALR